MIGRWPDPDFVGYSPNEKHTIDIFDANTGDLSLQLYDATQGGIISLNKFSNDGQFLCSGMMLDVHCMFMWRNRSILSVGCQSTCKASTVDFLFSNIQGIKKK